MAQQDHQYTAINILMYHSISDRRGPIYVPKDTFISQLGVLRDCGYQAVSLSDFAKWHAGELELPERSVVITFDDGFIDFAEVAAPRLLELDWPATVFVPSGILGTSQVWDEGATEPTQFMSWDQAANLARQGVEFGGHTVSHVDLTKLPQEKLEFEIRRSRDEIEQRVGIAPKSFAPPFGKLNETVRNEIAKCYDISVGTRLDRADRHCDVFDVPRIEMYYFRDISRWRAYLSGRGEWYFNSRKLLRRTREAIAF